MSQIVAVDLGGTHIRAAFFPTPQPPPATQIKTATIASEGPDAVLDRIIHTIEGQMPVSQEKLAIGVGAPGPLDPIRGVILDAPNLPGWIDIPLRDRLEEHFNVPVVIGNDANMAALGEWQFGAGKGTRHLIYLTISTGIGSGIIIDGQLVTGATGLAAELGHMTIDPNGPRCGCQQFGHLEAIAAGPAIARNAVAMLETGRASILREKYESKGEITSEDVGQAATKGDGLACAIVEEAGEVLGRSLASFAHAFNPEIFVLGGGVSQIGPLLFDTIQRAVKKFVMHPSYVENLRIVPAALGDDAGLIGAMVLASQL